MDPTIKNYHWLDLVMGLYDAYDRNAHNVILTDGEGYVTEGPGFNIFVLRYHARTHRRLLAGTWSGRLVRVNRRCDQFSELFFDLNGAFADLFFGSSE